MDLDQDQEVEVPNKKLRSRSNSTELSPGVDNSTESEAMSSGPQTCLFCGKVSKSEQELRRHMYYYHKERNCKHCGEVFSGTHFLIAHVSKQHTQVVQCEDCGQVWITKRIVFRCSVVPIAQKCDFTIFPDFGQKPCFQAPMEPSMCSQKSRFLKKLYQKPLV